MTTEQRSIVANAMSELKYIHEDSKSIMYVPDLDELLEPTLVQIKILDDVYESLENKKTKKAKMLKDVLECLHDTEDGFKDENGEDSMYIFTTYLDNVFDFYKDIWG